MYTAFISLWFAGICLYIYKAQIKASDPVFSFRVMHTVYLTTYYTYLVCSPAMLKHDCGIVTLTWLTLNTCWLCVAKWRGGSLPFLSSCQIKWHLRICAVSIFWRNFCHDVIMHFLLIMDDITSVVMGRTYDNQIIDCHALFDTEHSSNHLNIFLK